MTTTRAATCTEPGCDTMAWQTGLCQRHYFREYRRRKPRTYPTYDTECQHCGRTFTTTRDNQKRGHGPTCTNCGKWNKPNRKIRSPIPWTDCPTCSTSWPSPAAAARCHRSHPAINGSSTIHGYRDCTICRRLFPARTWAQVTCNDTCRNAWDEAKRWAKHQKQRGATIVEIFTRREILDRDNWTCWICHQPIDQSLPAGHRMAATIDHLDPVASGGHHSRANTRAAHMLCNSTRS